LADDVIADECALSPAPSYDEDEARSRLAESVFRRYPQLTAGPAGQDRRGGLRSAEHREALGLVLSGGLGYARASRVLGIHPRDKAALVHKALRQRIR
jgi:hypothetical protein